VKISSAFPRYTDFEPAVPVYCVTPNNGRTIHRFFDTSPFSPSGRYMALFRMPYEDRLPSPGDSGEIVVIDLHSGEETVAASTCGWEPQMGTNLQWAGSDEALLYNDVDTSNWQPFGVRLHPFSGEKKRLDGGVYKASPDGSTVLSANMLTMQRTQYGYGVIVPPEHVPRNTDLRDDDGLYVTDTRTGRCRLLASLKHVMQTAEPKIDVDYDNFEFYGFHSKYNPQGTKLIFTIRWFSKDIEPKIDVMSQRALRFAVFTMNADGSGIKTAVPPEQWEKGGHHINWFPDGENLSMNLNIDREGMRFVRCRYDGTGLTKMFDDISGSGHPTIHPNGRHILTDVYAHESLAFGDGTTPLRLIDRTTGAETALVRIPTETEHQKTHSVLRVDPHPAWDHEHQWIAFNAYVGGTRRVYVADLRDVLT